MSYSVEEVNSCTKKIIFNFPELDLTQEIQNSLKEKQKTSNLKGFRKGKAPLSMIQKFYGPQVESEALNKFVQNKFFDAVNEENIQVVGYPSFENVQYNSGESVSFDALVETFPEVELKDMSGLHFTRDKVEVTDEDVEAVKKDQLKSKAEMKEVEDPETKVDKGYHAVMNFQGIKEDGSRPENMKGEEFVLEIGSGQFIPGFEEGMLGMQAGEEKTIPVTFPQDYHVEELQNAKVDFDVELLEIKTQEYPEFTDELAKELGFESVDDFYTKTKQNLEQQKKKEADENLHQEILEKLIEENSFDVPQAMVEQQEEHVKQDLQKNLQAQGFNEEMAKQYFESWQDDLKQKAEFQVRSGLILDKLAKKYEVESTEEDLEAKIEETAQGSGLDAEQIRQYYMSNEELKKNMMYAIREEKTFDKLKEEVTVTEK